MSFRNRGLTDAELAEILENLDASEDDFDNEFEDFSDSESVADPDLVLDEEHDAEHGFEESEEVIGEDIVNDFPTSSHENVSNVNGPQKKGKKNSGISWRKRHLQIDEDALRFKGSIELPNEILELETPYDFFDYFFSEQIIGKITDETNLYSVQRNPAKPANVSTTDVRKFIGVCTYMSIAKLPRTRCYWRQDIGIPTIRNVMTINEFEKLKSILHFNDNNTMLPKGDPQYDNLHKIRPLITELNSRFVSIPMGSKLSVDEQICSTKTRHHLKQYNPMKPHKWGFKLFMLCDTAGFSYNFEIYNGASNWFTRLAPGEENLGASSNVVIRLARKIPRNMNYQLYCDNYYTSIPLFKTLSSDGIFMLGTVRRNRIPNCPLKAEKELKKEPRGTIEEHVANVDGVDLSVIAWNDNKVVTLISTCFGELPHHPVNRFDKKEKKSIEISCPQVIFEYNKHMGGVDLLDSHLGRYRIPLRSKKWYLRLFFHLLDITLINSFLLFQRTNKWKNIPQNMSLWQFRLEVAETLCLLGTGNEKKRGRPSSAQMEEQIEKKRHRGPIAHLPPKNVRQDSVAHWIKYDEKRQRCKVPNCKGFTHFKCEKCGIHLCLTKDKNCFSEFHLK